MATEFHYIHNATTGETLRVVSLPSMGYNSPWKEVTQAQAERHWADAREAAALAEAMAAAPPPLLDETDPDDLSGTSAPPADQT